MLREEKEEKESERIYYSSVHLIIILYNTIQQFNNILYTISSYVYLLLHKLKCGNNKYVYNMYINYMLYNNYNISVTMTTIDKLDNYYQLYRWIFTYLTLKIKH